MVDYRPVYSKKKRLGIAFLSLIIVLLGLIIAAGIYVGTSGSGVGIIGAIITFLVSIAVARTVFWIAFHGRKPEWSDVPDRH